MRRCQGNVFPHPWGERLTRGERSAPFLIERGVADDRATLRDELEASAHRSAAVSSPPKCDPKSAVSERSERRQASSREERAG
ncbi:MAG: hypothetical protein N0A16_13400 [Blastocatellia bacterium]|nr:hypothetical protein [Blastocatellia bacterium]MCX7753168.1 hypothetical protein [Blastocatellia bacterium]